MSRSHQCGSISPSPKMQSLQHAKFVNRRFPAVVQFHGWQLWCSIWRPSTLTHTSSFNKEQGTESNNLFEEHYASAPAFPSRICGWIHVWDISPRQVHSQKNGRDDRPGFPVLCGPCWVLVIQIGTQIYIANRIISKKKNISMQLYLHNNKINGMVLADVSTN